MAVEDLINKIDVAREESGILPKEFCKMAGISYGTYQHWREGTVMPTLAVFINVAKVLGFRVELVNDQT